MEKQVSTLQAQVCTFRAGDHHERNLFNKDSTSQLPLPLPVHFHFFPPAAGRYEEEGGTGGLVSGGSRGEPQEGAAGAGQPDAAAGGEGCSLRQAGQDKNPSAAGAGRSPGGPTQPEAGCGQPGAQAEEV